MNAHSVSSVAESPVEKAWEIRLPSPGMQAVRRAIDAVRGSEFPVLVLGESGTGKEVVVDAIHRVSLRASGPYVKVNCAGFVESLIESELFGHEKGAFTGAHATKAGKFEQAHLGTLFLDEVAELGLSAQAKLLRVLQDGSYERVGGVKSLSADVRLIAATNRDLSREVREGRFREDLFYRLNVLRIVVPPLRDRPADVMILAVRFLRSFSLRYGKAVDGFSAEAVSLLENYRFPGNVRELENVVARAYTMTVGPKITPADLPDELRTAVLPTTASGSWNLAVYLDGYERGHLRNALAAAGGNRSLAAEWLGISRRQLYNKLDKFELD